MPYDHVIEGCRAHLEDVGLIEKGAPLPEVFTKDMVFAILDAAQEAVDYWKCHAPLASVAETRH